MSIVIIFQHKDDGGVSVVHPIPECSMTDEETALKSVPNGRKYKFIDSSELPSSREFRNAWEVDFSTFDGLGAGEMQ